MSYVSSEFLIGFILTALLYFICPGKFRWLILLAASLSFYWRSEGWVIGFILFVSVFSYGVARIIAQRNLQAMQAAADQVKQIKAKVKVQNKRLLIFALVVMIGLLIYCKFAGKLVLALGQMIRGGEDASIWKVIFPLGISYFTFSAVGYVLDVYWKRYDAEKNFLRYLLYMTYFPHVVQGPIPRYGKLGDQFKKVHRFSYERITFGAQLIVWGFFQKLVIADRLSDFVSYIYNDVSVYPGSAILFSTFLYAFQIYTDFSGCVDIARGVSQIFGIELELNFRQPYFATSVDDFWRRWHITLGAWFRDYLAMPVTVSPFVKKCSKTVRKKYGRRKAQLVTIVFPLVAVWVCTGAWHGTGWNYILWGVWQGGIIIISKILEPTFTKINEKLHIRTEGFPWHLFRIIRTFILAGIIPRLLVRSANVPQAMLAVRRIFTSFRLGELRSVVAASGVSKVNWGVAVVSLFMLFVISLLKERGVSIRASIAKLPLPVRWALYLSLLYFVIIFGIYGPGYDAKSFIYADF